MAGTLKPSESLMAAIGRRLVRSARNGYATTMSHKQLCRRRMKRLHLLLRLRVPAESSSSSAHVWNNFRLLSPFIHGCICSTALALAADWQLLLLGNVLRPLWLLQCLHVLFKFLCALSKCCPKYLQSLASRAARYYLSLFSCIGLPLAPIGSTLCRPESDARCRC